jgi:hypothetical protein
MIANDGAVFSFGGAVFLGSTGGKGSNIVGITTLQYARGYAWADLAGHVALSATLPRVVMEWKTSGLAMAVLNDSQDPSAVLVLAPEQNSLSDQWDFYLSTDKKTVQMVNVNSRLCADLTQDAQG